MTVLAGHKLSSASVMERDARNSAAVARARARDPLSPSCVCSPPPLPVFLFRLFFLSLSIYLRWWHDGTRFVVTLWRALAAPIVLSLAITGHEVGGT